MVAVEDHLYHTAEMLDAMARAAPALLGCTTVCVIDDPGPDTSSSIAGWLERYDGIQVAARVDGDAVPPQHAQRVRPIDAAALSSLSAFARVVASLLRPGGVQLQDVHLSTLRFIPPDRWWESIYVAATVRGMFAGRAPAVRFVSNKRGYTATFGRDLMEAGFDPREVMDKSEVEAVVVPAIARDVDLRFPLDLFMPRTSRPQPVGADEDARREVESELDLVEWELGGKVELGGRLLGAPVAFRSGSQEALTWQQLIADRLGGGPGIPISAVGQRLAAEGAERAEISNLAARHIHALRARLSSAAAIVTANHAYRIDGSIAVGSVRRRSSPHLR